ncbi:MAG: hypothetical protein WBV82_22200 [Myxococcaceae bacterium]
MKTFIRSFVFVVTALVFAGCGNPGQAFVGLYSVNGHQTLTMNLPDGAKTQNVDVRGNANIYEGLDSDLILNLDEAPGCVIKLNADNSENANIVPGSSCTMNSGTNTITVTFNSGMAIMRGHIVTYTASGSLTWVGNGATVTGSFNDTLTLTKLSK